MFPFIPGPNANDELGARPTRKKLRLNSISFYPVWLFELETAISRVDGDVQNCIVYDCHHEKHFPLFSCGQKHKNYSTNLTYEQKRVRKNLLFNQFDSRIDLNLRFLEIQCISAYCGFTGEILNNFYSKL